MIIVSYFAEPGPCAVCRRNPTHPWVEEEEEEEEGCISSLLASLWAIRRPKLVIGFIIPKG